MTITFDKDLKIKKPGPGADLGQFEIKDFQVIPPTLDQGIVHHSVVYTIAIYETGRFVLPPAEAIASIDGSNFILKSKPISIEIKSSLTDYSNQSGESIEDIEVAAKTPGKIPPRYYIYAAIICLSILIGWLLWLFRKKIFRKSIPAKSPYLVAFDDLNELIKTDLIQAQNYKPFYYALSMIVRKYLETTKGIPATTKTTKQIKGYIKGASINQADMYIHLFTYADRVKFSTFTPSQEKTLELVEILKRQLLEDKKLSEVESTKNTSASKSLKAN